MSKPDWDPAGCHPTPGLLLRYSELELPECEMEQVKDHLQRCWSCCAEFENLKQGIWAFMEFHEKILLPGVPVDCSLGPARPALLDASSEDNHALSKWGDAVRHFFTRISAAGLRPAWIAGAISAAAIFAFIYLGMMSPAPLLASEFIHNVRNSLAEARKSDKGKLVVQKVRLRHGGFVTDREIANKSRSVSTAAAATGPAWFCSMSTALTWENPLSFDSILEWRTRQTSLSENISIDSGLVTLRLTLKEPEPAVDENVREVLVTARKADWHVINKRVEFWDGPSIEATEIAYFVVERPGSMAPTKSAKVVSPAHTRSSFVVSVVLPAELDLAEVRAFEVLFQNRADLSRAEEPLSLSRIAGSVRVQGVISDPAARDVLKRALAAIPHVSDEIRSATAFGTPKHLTPDARSSLSNDSDAKEIIDPPLLRKRLVESLGGEQQATDFANRILEASGESYSLSVQYRDLAQHFQTADEKLLTQDARMELDNLAHEMENALRAQLNHEAELLAPFLKEDARPNPAVNPNWQDHARILFQIASQKQQCVSRLFAVTGHRASEKTSAEIELGRLTEFMHDMRASIP